MSSTWSSVMPLLAFKYTGNLVKRQYFIVAKGGNAVVLTEGRVAITTAVAPGDNALMGVNILLQLVFHRRGRFVAIQCGIIAPV